MTLFTAGYVNMSAFERLSDTEIRKLVDVDVIGTMFLTRLFISYCAPCDRINYPTATVCLKLYVNIEDCEVRFYEPLFSRPLMRKEIGAASGLGFLITSSASG